MAQPGWAMPTQMSSSHAGIRRVFDPMIHGMLGGGFIIFLNVHPYLGKISILTNIFQRGLKKKHVN